MTTPLTTDELNALRTRLSNFGHGNWAGKTTATLDDQLRIAQACVDALDQFDRYEAEIFRLRERERALLDAHTGCGCEPTCAICREKGFT